MKILKFIKSVASDLYKKCLPPIAMLIAFIILVSLLWLAVMVGATVFISIGAYLAVWFFKGSPYVAFIFWLIEAYSIMCLVEKTNPIKNIFKLIVGIVNIPSKVGNYFKKKWNEIV